jgi:glycosyltransferase involved in cell wall biosynthesis
MNGIVMLVNEYAPLMVGGAERQAERLASFLAGRGWSVWVLTRRNSDLPSSETRSGVQVIRPETLGPGKLQTLSFVLGCWKTLWQLRHRYQLLHAHLAFGPAFAAVLAARLLGKKAIVKLGNSGHFGDIHTSQATLRGRLRLFVLRHWANCVIILDDTMRCEALAAGFPASRLVQMNNGIDAGAFSPDSKRAEGTVNVLYIGRLTAQKSLPVLLDAFAHALQDCPELRLTLVGDGMERSALESMTKDLGLNGKVTFAGAQEEVRPYLQAADMFALPSASEGISNALLEAMSSGLACLATAVGGNADVLDQGRCGVLLPEGDIPAWNAALSRLGNDREARLQLGTAARQRIQDVFDFSVVGSQYEELYQSLLDGAGR